MRGRRPELHELAVRVEGGTELQGYLIRRFLQKAGSPVRTEGAADVVIALRDSEKDEPLEIWLDGVLTRTRSGIVIVEPEWNAEVAHQVWIKGFLEFCSIDQLTPELLAHFILAAYERGQAKQRERWEQDRLRTMIDSIVDGVLVVDGEGCILFANPAAGRMLGKERDALEGTVFGFPVVAGDHAEVELFGARSEPSIVELRAAPIEWEDGPANLVSLRDISIRKRVEAERRRDQKRIQTLAAQLARVEERERRRVAHILHDDLQQILVGAQMHAGQLRRGKGSPEAAVEIEELLKQAISLSKSLSSELHPALLNERRFEPPVRALVESNRHRYHQRIELICDPGLEVHRPTFRTFLYQSVRELLLNAGKHAEGANCRVTLKRSEGEMVTLTVSDDGPGFDVERWNQRGIEEEGLGLFRLQQQCLLEQGEFELESQPGMGTLVRLSVPDPPEGS